MVHMEMKSKLSKRLADIVNALPLKDGIRILEIGCGPGAMAREISGRIANGHVLAIDRSAKAIQQAMMGSKAEIEAGRLSFRQAAIEEFDLQPGEKLFDIAIAVRVGALDGRHPESEKQALAKIAKTLDKEGKLFIDGGNPLKEINLATYR
jgi:cyclopropane fatty-acyl-phospholipid synthase-like methyltransferase